jgi:hypothetical protein
MNKAAGKVAQQALCWSCAIRGMATRNFSTTSQLSLKRETVPRHVRKARALAAHPNVVHRTQNSLADRLKECYIPLDLITGLGALGLRPGRKVVVVLRLMDEASAQLPRHQVITALTTQSSMWLLFVSVRPLC